MGRIRRHVTFSNVASLMALVFAMGGTGYAISALPKDSVGTRQLKKNAVVSSKVKNRSLTALDFKAGQLPKGPQGLQGLQGKDGTPGRPGADGANGTAVAFARVNTTGVLIGGADQSKNVTAENIQHTAGAPAAEVTGDGVYCFGGLGFTPKSAVVALDNTDSLPAVPNLTGGSLNFIPTVAVFKGEDLGRCDPTHGQVRVAIEQVNDSAAPTLANHGFLIWFE
jgi:hypothetical protein